MIYTIIVACITAVAAIVAPIITALINNRHQLKMKQLELYEEKRIMTINQYISTISCYVHHPTAYHEKDMSLAMNSIFLYAPQKVWKDISELNSSIENQNLVRARELLPKVSRELSPSVFKFKN